MHSVKIKKREEIELIRHSANILSKMLGVVVHNAKPGVSLLQLDKIAEEYILDNEALPGCKNYEGFPNTLCLSVNDKVVHGIPNNYILKDGDIVSIDSCVLYKGFYSDATYTAMIGNVQSDVQKMVQTTKESLYCGIENCRAGKYLGDIGHAIEQKVTSEHFHVVKQYSGHGIGEHMHEAPLVLNYGKPGAGMKIKNGFVLAIEPIVGFSTGETRTLDNGWDVVMKDGCMSAHFEHTVAVYDDIPHVLTTFEYCEK